MEDNRENVADDATTRAPASDLAERLARRHSETPGVIDVSAPRHHYTRTAGWVAQKFSLVNRVRDRYGVADMQPAAQQSFVMRKSPHDAPEMDDIIGGLPSSAPPSNASHFIARAVAPQAFAAPTAEQSAARAVILPPSSGDGSVQSAGDSSISSSGVRVRRPSVRANLHAGPSGVARVAVRSQPASGTVPENVPSGGAQNISKDVQPERGDGRTPAPREEAGAAGDAPQAQSVPSVKAESSSNYEGGASHPALVMRKAPVALMREVSERDPNAKLQASTHGTNQTPAPVSSATHSQTALENHEGGAVAASETVAKLSRRSNDEDSTSAHASPTPSAASSATARGERALRASGGAVMRSGDKGAPAQSRTEIDAQTRRGHLPLVRATGAASLLRARSSRVEAGVSSASGAAVGRVSMGAAGDQSPANVTDVGKRPATVAAVEITGGGAASADAAMVWRRTATTTSERADVTAPSSSGTSTLRRQVDGSSSTTTLSSSGNASPAPSAQSSTNDIDVGGIAEQVIRTISRRLAVERERRGFRK